MLERIKAMVAERLAAARALIDAYVNREPLASGSAPQGEA